MEFKYAYYVVGADIQGITPKKIFLSTLAWKKFKCVESQYFYTETFDFNMQITITS